MAVLTACSTIALWPPLPWEAITHLGDAALLLPLTCAMMVGATVAAAGQRPKLAWVTPILFAYVLTLASKLAFLTWGLGGRFDFTGLSGHAVLSACTYPVFAFRATRRLSLRARWLAAAAAAAVAIGVAASRLALCVHSEIEVVSGVAVGAGAAFMSIAVLAHMTPDRPAGGRLVMSCATFLIGALILGRAVPQDLMVDIARMLVRDPVHQRSELLRTVGSSRFEHPT